MSKHQDSTHTEKGASLAKGPAWIVGSVLAVFGLVLFWKAPGTPLPTQGFPDGAASGPTFLGFEINAWTAWITTAAGVLVLIGVLQHLIAKAMSLVVGIALAVAAAMALIDGDVLGLAAANGWTALGWAVAAAILIIAALLPRRTHEVRDRTATTTDHRERETVAARDARPTRDEHTTRGEHGDRDLVPNRHSGDHDHGSADHDADRHDEPLPSRVTPVIDDGRVSDARQHGNDDGRFARHEGHDVGSTDTTTDQTGQTVRFPTRNRD